MRTLILAAGLCAIGANAQANELPNEHINALACLEVMETKTTWSQCLGMIFQPCAPFEVGSDNHLSCLREERTNWSESLEVLQSDVREVISDGANGQLTQILDNWNRYVTQKCEEAGVANAASSGDAARLGCQVAEIVGLTGEYAACLEGRSKADYCTIKP